jgi:hypothetical protein
MLKVVWFKSRTGTVKYDPKIKLSEKEERRRRRNRNRSLSIP